MLKVETEREADGRWIAEIEALPGVLAYGQTREEAIARAQSLALRVLADRLEHGEPVPDIGQVFAVTP
jgi:predicted RNase H-like HicB family nuclease